MKNSFSYQQSLPLKLRPSLDRHDFIVGESNKEAVNWIDSYSIWKYNGLIIIGPNSSGKSHLVSTLKHKTNCIVLKSNDINKEKIDLLNLRDLVIENIEEINNYNFFLHTINLLKEKKFKVILTSRVAIQDMNIKLNDLRSRLLALPSTKILLPTDDVLKGIIIKLSKDKGLSLNNSTINFIVSHIERSYIAIHTFIDKLDRLALENKKKITIPFIKKLLEK